MKKYIIIILSSMLLLTGGLTNAQTIKRSKQKTEQRSKPKKEKQAKNSGTKKKEQSSQSNTPKQSKANKKPIIRTQNKYKKSVIPDKRINQLILDLIDNMVYVQVKDLRYSADQYKNRTRNPFDKNAQGSEASREFVGGFYICKYEVTQELWSAVMGYNPSTFSNSGSSQYPVDNVTWEECQEFIYELNDLVRGSVDFRMPTEEEWEYAAKGGLLSNGNKYSGSTAPQRVAWYERNSNGTTHQVGTMKPNDLGLYDMSGNVSEWCETLFDRYYDEDEEYELSPYYDPDTRACRGGSWNDNNANCCIKSRYEYNVDIEKPTIGLRLAASQIDPYE